jgi:alcohol dehydrogenase (cytochrome c)
MNPAYKGAAAPSAAAGPSPAAADWPSYNKTLSSERFSDLSQTVGRIGRDDRI